MPPKAFPKGLQKPVPPNQILTDLRRNQWHLGPLIGQGGHGYLYLGSDNTNSKLTENATYVIKMEPKASGPLFVEWRFYQNAAAQEKLSSWKKHHKLTHLGVPRLVGLGLFSSGTLEYRFLVMDRYGQDVEKIFLESSKKFPLQTVFSLGLRMIEALEYIHEQEYVHADIKASNILVGYEGKNSHLVFLVDYGLATRYCIAGDHVKLKEDPKKKHDGTIEYTSRDAHRGLAPSRRGDLEILAYCMLQWIVGKLPWENNLKSKDFVSQEKIKFMKDVTSSLKSVFGPTVVPAQLEEFFKYVNALEYTEKPDYARVKKWFQKSLEISGHPDDGKSVYFAKPSIDRKKPVSEATEKAANGVGPVRKRKTECDLDNSTSQVIPRKRRGKTPEAQTEEGKLKPGSRKESPSKRQQRTVSKSRAKGKQSPGKVKKSPGKVKKSPGKVKKSPGKVKKLSSPKNKAPLESAVVKNHNESTRRSTRRKKNVETVDFAQSP